MKKFIYLLAPLMLLLLPKTLLYGDLPPIEAMRNTPLADPSLPQNTLSLRIVEKQLSSPIMNATVIIYKIGDNFQAQSTSNSLGKVSFSNLSPGYYVASITTPKGNVFSDMISLDSPSGYRMLLDTEDLSLRKNFGLQSLTVVIQSTLSIQDLPKNLDIALLLISKQGPFMITGRNFSKDNPIITFLNLPITSDDSFYTIQSINPQFWIDSGAIKIEANQQPQGPLQYNTSLYATTNPDAISPLVIAPSVNESPRILVLTNQSQKIIIEETLPIVNTSQKTIVFPRGLIFSLPKHVKILNLQSSHPNHLWTIESNNSQQFVAIRGLFPANSTSLVTMQYEIQWNQARSIFEQKFPIEVQNLSIAIKNLSTIQTTIQPVPQRMSSFQQNSTWDVFSIKAVLQQTPLQISLLAQDTLFHSTFFRWGAPFMGVLILLLGLFISFGKRRTKIKQLHDELLNKKLVLLQQIAQLQQDLPQTQLLKEELVKIYAAIDKLERFFVY